MECRMQRLYGQWCYKRTEHRMFRSYLRHFGYRSTYSLQDPPIPGSGRTGGIAPRAPTRDPLKRRIIYTMRIAPRPRDHARDPRAPVRSCWHVKARTNATVATPMALANGSRVTRSLFVDPALYTVKVRINNNCLLQGMPTRHRYKSCVWSMLYALRMHYVSCSVLGRRGYVGAVWGVASHPSATHVVYFCACA